MADEGSSSATLPLLICGNDHSPWVQAVLLGLHEKRQGSVLRLSPPLDVFLESGVLMPVARIDGRWLRDSERILVELGYAEVEPETSGMLMGFFGSSALRRADRPREFWHRFSWVRDGAPGLGARLAHQFWRSFSMLYFFTLITLSRFQRPPATREHLVEQLSFFQQRIPDDADFFGGDAPDTVDLQLFGLVQMCASIPGTALEVLRNEAKLERLRRWVTTMQSRFRDYDHLYSAHAFEPRGRQVEPAPAAERVAYWVGAACMVLALPLTLPAVFFFVRRVRVRGHLPS